MCDNDLSLGDIIPWVGHMERIIRQLEVLTKLITLDGVTTKPSSAKTMRDRQEFRME
jgi:hypothetical protein